MPDAPAILATGWNVEVLMHNAGDPDIARRREADGRAFAKAVLAAIRDVQRPEGFELATVTRARKVQDGG